MENNIDLVADLTDLDRNGRLPISALMTWAQKCRVALYHQSAAVLDLRQRVGGTLMVKTQEFTLLPAFRGGQVNTTLLLNRRVRVTQRVTGVGKSSFTLGIEFHVEGEVLMAVGSVVMVCVAEGKSREIPADLRQVLFPSALDSPPPPPSSSSSSTKWTHSVSLEVRMRASDEDTNLHVKHVRYCHFLEDCVQELGGQGVGVARAKLTYMKECRRGELFVTRLKYNDTGAAAAWFEMTNSERGRVCTAEVELTGL